MYLSSPPWPQKTDHVFRNFCICWRCWRQTWKELLIILWRSLWSGRNWQLICLNTGKLCVMIVHYYCHFFPSNSAKLHIIQHRNEWHNTIFANPSTSLSWTWHNMQDTCKTAEDYASYKSHNLYQMYVEKAKNGFQKCPVVIFCGATWAWGHSGYSPPQLPEDQGCPFRNTSVLTTAPNSTSADLLASVSLNIPQPHSHAKNAMHPQLPVVTD